MIEKRKLLVLALLAAFTCPPLHGERLRQAGPTRVLFIGNSYTFFNNLPEIFKSLAEAAGAGRVEVEMAAFGGGRLEDHWRGGEAREMLRHGRWDYVVLQEQSTLGVSRVVDGTPRVTSDEVFIPAVERWAKEIERAGARAVLFLTWARKAAPEDQKLLTAAYLKAAARTGALVSPAGVAWDVVRREAPEVELFTPDGSHPSPAGSYLAACTLAAAVFDRSPEGLPGRISGTPVNIEKGELDRGRTAVLVDIAPGQAKVLQAAAWRAIREM